jgi:hypothetical protein
MRVITKFVTSDGIEFDKLAFAKTHANARYEGALRTLGVSAEVKKWVEANSSILLEVCSLYEDIKTDPHDLGVWDD